MLNLFMYILNCLRGVFLFLLSVLCVGLLKPARADATYAMTNKAEKYETRARLLTKSLERNFFDKISGVLHNNSRNWFTPSGCWDVSALLTHYTKMAALDPRYAKDADRAIYALGFYGRKTEGGGFSGYTGTWNLLQNNSKGYVYYDDNMWIGRDLVTLYELTGDKKYLKRAITIADMLIAEGWTDLDEDMFTQKFGRAPGGSLGGFYWRSDHDALHTCSNGPAIQFLTMLSSAADNGKGTVYLEYAQKAYRFLRYLERSDGTFWDLMKFHKDNNNFIIGIDTCAGPSLSYNSGTPISCAVVLYQATADDDYLEDAAHWAASADAYFAKPSNIPGLKTFTDLPWFREVLLMGYIDLHEYNPAASGYIQNMEYALNYGYETHRLNGVLGFNQNVIPPNWTEGFAEKSQKQSAAALEQIPCGGIYASLALFYGK